MAAGNRNLVPTTQRAYTMRIRPACSPEDSPEQRRRRTIEMQSALWATHEAVNRGAKAFGEWLLTLRGGLDHRLVDSEVKGEKGTVRPPLPEEIKNRRILLALSWLSVEDESGAQSNPDFIVACGDGGKRRKDSQQERNSRLAEALRGILQSRNVPSGEIGDPQTPGTWLGDCAQSLFAAIRPDAVWVNRSAIFTQACATFQGLDSRYATEKILSFFGPQEEYFKIADSAEKEPSSGSDDDGADFRQRARQWMSTNFGTGEKSDTHRIGTALEKLANCDLNGCAGMTKSKLKARLSMALGTDNSDGSEEKLRVAIGWSTGRPSKGRLAVQNLPEIVTDETLRILQKKFAEEAAEKLRSAPSRNVPLWIAQFQKHIEGRVGVPYVCARNLIGEYSVMLDHAARRVSIVHSWIKRAEGERRSFEVNAGKIQSIPEAARKWLDGFSETRSNSTGASVGYRIRPRAVEGWDVIVQRWSQKGCDTPLQRIVAARAVQADWDEGKKFGDIQLFEALASDEAKVVWKIDGKSDPSLLVAYAAARDAAARQVRFKVPAYRHPDALLHPVFCDFGNSRWDIRFAVHDRERVRTSGKKISKQPTDSHGLRMGLWNGDGIDPYDMRWESKRLSRDLALDDLGRSDTAPVTIGSRFGRAAAPPNSPVAILNVFDENDWNGRLQLPRAQLDRIALLLDRNKVEAAERLRHGLDWFLTFSPRLQPSGPFHEFATLFAIKPNRGGEYFPNAEHNRNAKREGKAKLILSRLPGLRVLSVDLGHRFAAACAVWEALSAPDFAKEIDGRDYISGGTGSANLYLHTHHKDETGKERTTIYRRIGEDTLPNGTPHPAPWARLDRQFLIKLQGEERSGRKATKDELGEICRMEESFGRQRQSGEVLPTWVEQSMSHAVRTARLALRRHGDRARIAFAMQAEYKPMPGDRKYHFSVNGTADGFDDAPEQRRQKHIEFIQDALLQWHNLFSSKGWQDEAARELWQEHIATLPGYQAPDSIGEEISGPEREKKHKANLERLSGAAEALLQDAALRFWLNGAWKSRWESDDLALRGYLRRLQDWLRPGAGQNAKMTRNVGGLSLTRLATLTELRRKVQVGFFTRLHPDGKKESVTEQFGQKTLNAIEQMREQRVKQLASRIVEAALGLGRMKQTAGPDRQRPCERTDMPCHAVVIESLRNYRPDELQTRRENRALMDWSSGKVRKYLAESCQLYGLHLREVPPNYTSRQCSRTGMPGIRCADVPVEQFRTAQFWRKVVNSAKKRIAQGGTAAEDKFFCDLEEAFGNISDSKTTLRLPRKGGDLFVAAPAWDELVRTNKALSKLDTLKRAIQADLNAAANIGLRALLDPDFLGTWWYVPCSAKDGKAAQDKVKGSACFGGSEGAFLSVPKKSAEKRDVVNAWRDLSALPLTDGSEWKNTTAYWNDVRARSLRLLQIVNRKATAGLGAVENCP